MSISRKITGDASGGSGGSSKYVDDVFSTYLYTGTGADRDIVNDIDLDDKGGLVWIKTRKSGNHALADTERDPAALLKTDTSNAAEDWPNGVTSFNNDGFSLGDFGRVNNSGDNFVSWSFAKQEGFFDVVTYTGDGVAGREIAHNLGSTPGMVIMKSTTLDDVWTVYHRSLGATQYLRLEETVGATTASGTFNNTEPTDSVFTLGASSRVNGASADYVAYLFANDAPMFGPDGDESIIKCGGYTGTGVTNEIDLGWEPQFLLFKNTTNSQRWLMYDSMRGMGSDAVNAEPGLNPNESKAELFGNNLDINATGFTLTSSLGSLNQEDDNYIYMAIRRPNKPAEEFEPDELFAVEEATADIPQYPSSFPVDMALQINDISSVHSNTISSRLTAGYSLNTDSSSAQQGPYTGMPEGWQHNKGWGWRNGAGVASPTDVAWMFRRAPGFFDVVTYEGDSVAGREVSHNLGVVPEMMWLKPLERASEWIVYCSHLNGGDSRLKLNTQAEASLSGNQYYWGDGTNVVLPTDTHFTLGGGSGLNGSSENYIMMLWASVPGICDIGTYTGTGDWQWIDCGFDTAIPRFVLIKSTSEDGDWYYWDTLRGITSGNDPYLQLNSTAAQVTNENWISPSPQGQIGGFFIESSSSSQIYKDGVEYIYMAIA
jgi:hypothetical protein